MYSVGCFVFIQSVDGQRGFTYSAQLHTALTLAAAPRARAQKMCYTNCEVKYLTRCRLACSSLHTAGDAYGMHTSSGSAMSRPGWSYTISMTLCRLQQQYGEGVAPPGGDGVVAAAWREGGLQQCSCGLEACCGGRVRQFPPSARTLRSRAEFNSTVGVAAGGAVMCHQLRHQSLRQQHTAKAAVMTRLLLVQHSRRMPGTLHCRLQVCGGVFVRYLVSALPRVPQLTAVFC
jgi:hypothetical protein